MAAGRVTAEKRIEPILEALATLGGEEPAAHLVIVGDASDYPDLAAYVTRHNLSHRVHVTGYVEDDRLGEFLSAADVCLCLRWPTALETSASWLRALAAGRPTIITALPHLADVPVVDARSWRRSHAGQEPVAIAVDLLEERESLAAAMRRLRMDAELRASLGRAAREYWSAGHTLELMADDYRRVVAHAAAAPAPGLERLPPHARRDYSELARDIARQLGVAIDLLSS